jgi:hypothetical protein
MRLRLVLSRLHISKFIYTNFKIMNVYDSRTTYPLPEFEESTKRVKRRGFLQ